MTMKPMRLLGLVLATLLGGCEGMTVETQRIPNVLRVSPADNSTGRATLWMTLSNSEAYAADLDDLAASSQLVTWPGLVPVPSHVDTPAPATPDVTSPGMAARALVADQTPPDGWYALLLGTVSPEARRADDLFHELPDGRWVARVRLGAAPDIWGYALCPKGDLGTVVIVRYSEQLHAATTATPLFIKAGPPGHEVDCEGQRAPQIDTYESDYQFLCGPLASTDHVIVDVKKGLATQFGPEVPEGQRTLDLTHLTLSATIASNCNSIKLDP